MNRIGDFLARFNLFVPVDTIVSRTISDGIRDVTGVTIDPKQITHTSGKAFVATHAVTKTNIALNQKKILETVNLRLKPYKVSLSSIS
jgi:hypothetical protein